MVSTEYSISNLTGYDHTSSTIDGDHRIVYCPDTKKIFYPGRWGNSLQVYNTLTKKETDIDIGVVNTNDLFIEYLPNLGLIAVIHVSDEVLRFIDPSSETVVNSFTLPAPTNINSMVYCPYNEYLYIPESGGSKCFVFDTKSFSIVTTISIAVTPAKNGACYDAANNKIILAVTGGQVAVIDVATNTVDGFVTTGTVTSMVYNPIDARIYAVNGETQANLVRFNVATSTIEKVFSSWDNVWPYALTISNKNGKIYIASWDYNIVEFDSVLETFTQIKLNRYGWTWISTLLPVEDEIYMTDFSGPFKTLNELKGEVVTKSIDTDQIYIDQWPYEMAYHPEKSLVYMTTWDNSVLVINPETLKVVLRIPTSIGSAGITYNHITKKFYVTSIDENKIIIIT